MKNLKNSVLTAIALLALIGSLVLSGSFRSQAASPDKEVVVVNSSADPVLVRDIDNRARQPFQEDFTILVPPGFEGRPAFFTVPTGKRLVIEYVSAKGLAPSGQSLWFSINTHLNGDADGKFHYLVAEHQGTTTVGPLDVFVTSQQTRLYADAGTSFVGAERNVLVGEAIVLFTISGYLVDVP